MKRVVAAVAAALLGVTLLTGSTVATPPADADSPDDVIDPVRGLEYWLDDYGITEAWETTRGAGVTIAVIDTGIARGPVELDPAVVGGTDMSGLGSTDGRTPAAGWPPSPPRGAPGPTPG